MAKHHLRRRLFVDRPVQTALLVRATLYWIVSLATQLLLVFFFAVVTSSSDAFQSHKPQLWAYLQLSVLSSLLLLPVFLRDILRLSHRWVGPIYRLRSSLQALSRGETVQPIRFRKSDFWQELAGDFNVVATELVRRREALSTEPSVNSVPAIGNDSRPEAEPKTAG
jgi:hypothetical protein